MACLGETETGETAEKMRGWGDMCADFKRMEVEGADHIGSISTADTPMVLAVLTDLKENL